MITDLKTKDGLVFAYIEWFVLDGQDRSVNYGEYLYVITAWIHEGYRNKKHFAELIDKMCEHPFNMYTKFVQWEFRRNEDRNKLLYGQGATSSPAKKRFYNKDKLRRRILRLMGEKNGFINQLVS